MAPKPRKVLRFRGRCILAYNPRNLLQRDLKEALIARRGLDFRVRIDYSLKHPRLICGYVSFNGADAIRLYFLPY